MNIKLEDLMTLEEAREQLLHQIELELCRILPGNSDAFQKYREFYDYVSSLQSDHFLFNWYAINRGKVEIKYIDGEVRILRIEDQRQYKPINDTNNELGEIVLDVFRKRVQN